MCKKIFILFAAVVLAAGSLLLTSGCRTTEADHCQMSWDKTLKTLAVSRDGKPLMKFSDQKPFYNATAHFKDELTVSCDLIDDPSEKLRLHLEVNDTHYIDVDGDMIFDEKIEVADKTDRNVCFFRYGDKWVRGENVSPFKETKSAELDGIGPVYFLNGEWVSGTRPAAKPAPKK